MLNQIIQNGFCKQNRILGLILLVVGLAGQLLPSAVKAQGQYTITDLGSLYGNAGTSVANGINFLGQVVGNSQPTDGTVSYHAFIYSNGKMSDIGTLGGTNSVAFGINILGQVVGQSSTADDSASHAFIYSNGKMSDIGTLGGVASSAADINILGQVVGSASTAAGEFPQHGFIYSNGKMSDIGTLIPGGFSVATAINIRGQVVGYASTSLVPKFSKNHAFIYSNGKMSDINTLGGDSSEAHAINTIGQVVGTSFTAGNAALAPFVYSNGKMRDLNSLLPPGSTWTLVSASGINDKGQIIGAGYTPNDLLNTHAFLMTPRP